MRWVDDITDSVDEFEQAQGVDDGHRKAWNAAVHGFAKCWTQLSE